MSPIRKDMYRDTNWLPEAGDEWRVGPTEITVTAVESVQVPGGREQIRATLEIRNGPGVETMTFQSHPKGYGRAWQGFLRKAAVRRGWPFAEQEKPPPGPQRP